MEEPVQFSYNNKRLYGILHSPDAIADPSTVIIIVTGGPQVRTGAHRLYVQLSRFLCEHNWPSLRFDYEGLGDSEGAFVGFQYAENSITAALKFLHNKFRRKLNFILWSLCDGATAAAFYAANHPEHISGLILCNPLVMKDEELYRSVIKHYYLKRPFNKDFLRKILSFKIDYKSSIRSLRNYLIDAQFFKNLKPTFSNSGQKYFSNMVLESLYHFDKPIKIILSKNDIVASNYIDEINGNKILKNDYKKKKIVENIINGADHTFVDPMAKKELFKITLKGVNEIVSPNSGEKHRST